MHKVAVYGSLRNGMGNHRLLERSKFVKYTDIANMAMVSLGAFPAAFPEDGSKIVAEVYEVDDGTLRSLDYLEGHPNFYAREQVIVDNEEVFVYVIQSSHYKTGERVPDGDWVKYRTGS